MKNMKIKESKMNCLGMNSFEVDGGIQTLVFWLYPCSFPTLGVSTFGKAWQIEKKYHFLYFWNHILFILILYSSEKLKHFLGDRFT